MRRIVILSLSLAVALVGCKAKEKADIAADLKDRGTIDLMKEAAEDKYEAPADGKLSDAQIKMYLKVREHEKKIAEVAREELKKHGEAAKKDEKSLAGVMAGFKAMGSVADLATADIRAAKDLKINSQEYLWVKGQILAASTSAMAKQASEAMTAQLDASQAEMKKAMNDAQDEQTKKMYADMLANYEKGRKDMAAQQEDPATTHNRELLKKYENEINAWTAEWSKYTENPQDAEKAMADWQKQIDAAKAGKPQQ